MSENSFITDNSDISNLITDQFETNNETENLSQPKETRDSKSSAEEDYDTDIEIKDSSTSYDHSGKTAYIKQCYKEGVIPAGYFLRHINEKKLDMSHHGLGLSGIKPICSSLMTNGTITSLDLTDNWLGDQSVPFLMVMMKENCFISELFLTNNNLTYKCAEMLALSLSENLQITRLDLSQNNFDDRAANSLGDLIMNIPKLEHLNLSKNKFGSECLLPFGKAISQAQNLSRFDLSWNHIIGKDIKHFCTGLSENSSIKTLLLGWNGLGSISCMQEIGKILKVNTVLEELDLSNNRITAEGAVLLGRGILVNNYLKILRIGQNPMQTAGCYAILSSVLKNPSTAVTLMDFEDIRVNQDFIDLKSSVPSTIVVLTGSRKPCRPSSSIHPVIRLKTFVKKHKLPLLKYFNHFDDAQNCNLTKNDFRLCLQHFCQNTNFDLTESEMDRLMEYLDKNQNGYIQYKDFMELDFSKEPESDTPSAEES